LAFQILDQKSKKFQKFSKYKSTVSVQWSLIPLEDLYYIKIGVILQSERVYRLKKIIIPT